MADIYLSPSGNDGNAGTIGSPKFTLEAGFAIANAGDTIYMRGGTYQYLGSQDIIGKNGSAGNLIKLWAYPGETPIITRSASYIPVIGVETDLIYMENCSYIHFKNLEISNYTQHPTLPYWFAFRGNDLSNCIFENINYHHNGSALTLRGNSTTGNLFNNCDFHHNQDPYSLTPYDGADGLNITYVNNSAAINTVRNCRAWWNADDGFDFWQNEGLVVIENNWSFYNGYIPDTFTTAGNGAGFKLGETLTTTTTVKRQVKNNIAFKNRNWGIVENNALVNMQIYNNTCIQNGTTNYWFGDWGSSPKLFKNNIGYNDGITGCLYGDCDQANHLGLVAITDHNTWDAGAPVVTYADFENTDDSQLDNARAVDGSLPTITFLKLIAGSDLIDAGVNVGLPFNGAAPDLGYSEYSVGGNVPPTANAGIDQNIMLPLGTVNLTGSGSDSDGTIASYAWSQISGPSATIVSPTSQNTAITGLTSAGTRVFRLTVTDNLGATGTDDVSIIVNQNIGIMAKHLLRMGIIASSATTVVGPPPSGLVDIDFTTLSNLQESPANKWIPVNNALDANGIGTVSLPALTDGQFQCEIQLATQNTDSFAICWDTSNAIATSYWGSAKYVVFPKFGTYWTNDNQAGGVDSTIPHADGDLLRLIRTGSVIKAQYYRGGSWTDILTFSGTDTGLLYYFAASAQDGTALALYNPKQEGAV